jgi:hypothetical protein
MKIKQTSISKLIIYFFASVLTWICLSGTIQLMEYLTSPLPFNWLFFFRSLSIFLKLGAISFGLSVMVKFSSFTNEIISNFFVYLLVGFIGWVIPETDPAMFSMAISMVVFFSLLTTGIYFSCLAILSKFSNSKNLRKSADV